MILLLALMAACSPAAARDDYQRILDRAVAKGVPGIQALVLQGDLEWSGMAGLATVETRDPMSLHHRIRLASVTKMMTYATIMELVRQGRLNLSDRAVDRLPAGAMDGIPHAADITIAQLLITGAASTISMARTAVISSRRSILMQTAARGSGQRPS